jgi:uncharacterized protein (TIGR03382 family)
MTILDTVGNVALFIPLGALLTAWLGRRRIPLAIAMGIALSAGVELAQSLWLPGRNGSVRDLLCNALGTAADAVLGWLALSRRARKRSRRPR